MALENGCTGNGRVVAIAVDGSSHSDNAFNWYLSHIMKAGDTVVLVHVPDMVDVADATDPDQVRECMNAKQRKMFNLEKKYMDLLQAKHAHLKSKFRTHGGKPGEFICKAAQEEGAELVVCGTRGHGTIRRTIMGSVSSYLVHHSHVPVLVCRQTH